MLSQIFIIINFFCTLLHPSVANVTIVSYDDLLRGGARFFSLPGVENYVSLLYDFGGLRHEILIGTANRLLRFDINFDLQENVDLAPTAEQVQKCSVGRPKEECANFVNIVVRSTVTGVNMIYACGTNAYDPMCSVRHVGDIGRELFRSSEKGKVPVNPRAGSAAFLGERFFLGSALDDLGKNATVLVTDLSSGRKPVSTGDGENWLNEAEFVLAFEEGEFVFFVFREVGIEAPSRQVYSRIGRVCQNDTGLRGILSSFTKARLECGDYNTVQGATYSPATKILYAAFTSSTNRSAVCWFDYSAIKRAFKGPFKCRKDNQSRWGPCQAPPSPNEAVKTCFGTRSSKSLEFILMHESVLPKCGAPIYEDGKAEFRVIDVVEDIPGGPFAFVGDANGQVWKLGDLQCHTTQALELWEATSKLKIKRINILSTFLRESVYLLTRDGVIHVPMKDFGPAGSSAPTKGTTITQLPRKPFPTLSRSAHNTLSLILLVTLPITALT